MCVWKTILAATLGTVAMQTANGEGVSLSFHEASGSGTANVFDGGPPASHSDSTFDPSDRDMLFGAVDRTRPGSLGAAATASGASTAVSHDDSMTVRVDFVAQYGGSLFPGGDNPGGMAEGEVASVIEFIMPVDELDWLYELRIDDTIAFEGSTSVVFENVTQTHFQPENRRFAAQAKRAITKRTHL